MTSLLSGLSSYLNSYLVTAVNEVLKYLGTRQRADGH